MADLDRKTRELIADLEAEVLTLIDARARIDVRLSRVRAALMTLGALNSQEPTEFEGRLADAIRTVLMREQKSYIPTQVRDMVKELGYVFKEDSNQMAAVHGVLKRLVESGTVNTKQWKQHPEVTRYYWAAFDKLNSEEATVSAELAIKKSREEIVADLQRSMNRAAEAIARTTKAVK